MLDRRRGARRRPRVPPLHSAPLIEITEAVPGVRRWRFATLVSRAVGYDVSAFELPGGLLIDSGFPHAWLGQAWRAAAWEGSHVLLTHADEDHAGGAPLFAAGGARILAPPAAVEALGRRPKLSPYQRLIWGTPDPVRAEPLPDAIAYAGGLLRVIATPGHAPDHVAFFDADRGWLFAGDLFISSKIRMARRREDLPRLVESLRRAADLEPEILFDAHAGVVRDAAKALAAKARWLVELGEEARRLRARGADVAEIRDRLLGAEPLGTWILTGGDFSKANLIRGLLEE